MLLAQMVGSTHSPSCSNEKRSLFRYIITDDFDRYVPAVPVSFRPGERRVRCPLTVQWKDSTTVIVARMAEYFLRTYSQNAGGGLIY